MIDNFPTHRHPALRELLPPSARAHHASGRRAALVCCPHAGGGANFFRPWAALMPPVVSLWALQYPGREERLGESPHSSMSLLLDELLQALQTLPQVPFVLFGHSMGAAIAFELCLRLQRGGRVPQALMLSSHPPPDEVMLSEVHLRDDSALWEEIIRSGGTAPEVLNHKDLMRVLTPPLRADYAAIESHVFTPHELVQTDVVICVGDTDLEVPADRVAGWQRFCARPVRVKVYHGGHFYLSAHKQHILAEVQQCLSTSLLTNIDGETP